MRDDRYSGNPASNPFVANYWTKADSGVPCGAPAQEEVIAKRFGNGVLLLPAEAPWQLMQEALDEFEPGFELQREQPEQQAREDWPP